MRALIYPTNLPENYSIPVTTQHDRVIKAVYFACRVPNIIFLF